MPPNRPALPPKTPTRPPPPPPADTARALNDLARRAGSVVQERFDGMGVDPREYAEMAGQRLDGAQKYVVDRINERPVPAALAALGIGVVIGMLLSGRRR